MSVWKRKNQTALIERYIEVAGIKELLDTEMEITLALEYLEIRQDYIGEVVENYKTAKAYVRKQHHYNFRYSLDNVFELIERFTQEFTGNRTSLIQELYLFLERETTLGTSSISSIISKCQIEWR